MISPEYIMALANEYAWAHCKAVNYGEAEDIQANADTRQALRAAIEQLHTENEALRAQNKEFRDVLAAACDSLGAFVSDHGWSDLDMQIFDNVCAALARAGEKT